MLVAPYVSVVFLTIMAPGMQSAVTASSSRYSVEALDPGGSGRPARVIISNLETSRRHMTSINSTLGELRHAVIRADQGRVILLCENGFAVIDPAGQVPGDEIYAADPIASPDGRWIAYKRFFPRTHPAPTDAVAVYDSAQPPDRNHAAYPIAAEREWHAGYAVYPPAADWKDASAVTPRETAHASSSDLMWLGGKEDLLLAFTVRSGDTDALVLADPGPDRIEVCTAPLPGSADAWRVKTIDLQKRGNDHQVTVTSGALDKPPRASFTFASESCAPGR